MTSASIPSRISFKTPFAVNGDKLQPLDDSGALNIEHGFTGVYSTPAVAGGKYVGRTSMNWLFYLATNDLFYHKCGGLNTFDADFAVKVGGYPKGAILKYIDGTDIHDVVSLVDDNKVDFTGTMPTQDQQTGGILPGSVDGVHWAFCNVQHPTRERLEVLSLENLPIGMNLPVATSTAYPIYGFTAAKSGALIANLESLVELSLERTDGYRSSTQQTFDAICGVGLVVKELASPSDYSSLAFPTLAQIRSGANGWKMIFADSLGGGLNFNTEIIAVTNKATNITPMFTTAGKFYAIAMISGSAETTSASYSGSTFSGSVTAKVSATVKSLNIYID